MKEKYNILLYEDGKSYNEIAGIVNRSKSTIHYIIKKSKNKGTLAYKARSSRPKKLTGREEKVIIRELKKKSYYIRSSTRKYGS